MSPKQFQEATRKFDMSQAEYAQNYYWRLAEPGLLQFNNFALGLTGEAGEVADILKKHLRDGKPIDRLHLIEELGDCLFYIARILDVFGASMEEAMEMNQRKLNVRYPSGFNEVAGRVRNTDEERKAMEGLNEETSTDS